jgi:AbiV family abortive infection protein
MAPSSPGSREPHRRLQQYKGRLTPAQAVIGMNAAAETAHRLYEDAQRLYDTGSFGTAASLAALSIEESGKISIVRWIACCQSDEEAARVWPYYRDHKSKSVMWIIADLVRSGAQFWGDFDSMFDRKSDHTAVLNSVKQLGFYSDCLGKGNWTKPWEAISEAVTTELLLIARILATERVYSIREVELWVEIVGNATEDRWSDKHIRSFYVAMEKEGLGNMSASEVFAFHRMSNPGNEE